MDKSSKVSNVIYKTLLERIVRLDYSFGSLLNENKLAEEFEVSRTPIREALLRLEKDNLVVLSRAGALIVPTDYNWMFDALEIRKTIDSNVAQYATLRSTDSQKKELQDIISKYYDFENKQFYSSNYIEFDNEIHNTLLKIANSLVFDNIFNMLHPKCKQFSYMLKMDVKATDLFVKSMLILVNEVDAIVKGNDKEAMKCAIDHVEMYKKILKS